VRELDSDGVTEVWPQSGTYGTYGWTAGTYLTVESTMAGTLVYSEWGAYSGTGGTTEDEVFAVDARHLTGRQYVISVPDWYHGPMSMDCSLPEGDDDFLGCLVRETPAIVQANTVEIDLRRL